MTPFEQGYKAYLDGAGKDANPFSKLDQSYSYKRWFDGWLKAKYEKEGYPF